MTDEARSLNITMDPDMQGGVWANIARVKHSPYEFTIDFIRADFDENKGRVVSRVNLSPLFVRQLIDALEKNWNLYAEKSMPREVQPPDESDGSA